MQRKEKILRRVPGLVLAGWILCGGEARATKKVYSPHVVQGEVESEAQGSVVFDSREDLDGAQKQKYALGYGVTGFWFTEIYGEIEKEAAGQEEGEGWTFEAVEWENRFQLSEPGERFIDTGLYFAYEAATEEDQADKVEGKLLLEKQWGEVDHILNLILEDDVGPNAEAGLGGGLAWSTRVRWKPYFEPGFEWHSDFKELDDGKSFNEQEHQLGPSVYGKIGDHIKYDLGYLSGISDAAPEGELKWILELEWYF